MKRLGSGVTLFWALIIVDGEPLTVTLMLSTFRMRYPRSSVSYRLSEHSKPQKDIVVWSATKSPRIFASLASSQETAMIKVDALVTSDRRKMSGPGRHVGFGRSVPRFWVRFRVDVPGGVAGLSLSETDRSQIFSNL